tara:strand:- start:961 stop:2064 length:1104 start_codon:yes stop_codon:yes gene_type:complete
MKILLYLLLFFQLTTVSTTASSSLLAENKENIYGTWTGQIGNSDVVVCISKNDSNYYYLKYTKKIPLSLDLNGRGFEYSANEYRRYDELANKPSGEWHFIINNQKLNGELLLKNNRYEINLIKYSEKSLPKSLEHGLEDQIDRQKCPMSFYIPIINARIKDSSNSTGDVILSNNYDNSDRFIYNPHYLQSRHKEIISAAIEHYNLAELGGFSSIIEIKKIYENDWFILIKTETSSYDGNISFDEYYTLLDRYTKFSIENWIKIENFDNSLSNNTLPPFAKLLRDNYIDRYSSDDEINCREEMLNGFFPTVALAFPTKTGVVFQLKNARAVRVCDQEVEVRWHDLKAHMSPEGWRTMSRMTALPVRNK